MYLMVTLTVGEMIPSEPLTLTKTYLQRHCQQRPFSIMCSKDDVQSIVSVPELSFHLISQVCILYSKKHIPQTGRLHTVDGPLAPSGTCIFTNTSSLLHGVCLLSSDMSCTYRPVVTLISPGSNSTAPFNAKNSSKVILLSSRA